MGVRLLCSGHFSEQIKRGIQTHSPLPPPYPLSSLPARAGDAALEQDACRAEEHRGSSQRKIRPGVGVKVLDPGVIRIDTGTGLKLLTVDSRRGRDWKEETRGEVRADTSCI